MKIILEGGVDGIINLQSYFFEMFKFYMLNTVLKIRKDISSENSLKRELSSGDVSTFSQRFVGVIFKEVQFVFLEVSVNNLWRHTFVNITLAYI